MVVTLGEHYNVGEKPTVILYTYINRHAEPPNIAKHDIAKHKTLLYIVIIYCTIIVPSNHTKIGARVNSKMSGGKPTVIRHS